MKIKLIVLFMCLTYVGLSQLEVKETIKPVMIGKAKRGGVYEWGSLYYTARDKDTTFSFIYKDEQYSKIEVFEQINFKGGQKTVDAFYSLLISTLDKKEKDKITSLKLGDKDIQIVYLKVLGSPMLMIQEGSKYVKFTRKEIDKIFNKD